MCCFSYFKFGGIWHATFNREVESCNAKKNGNFPVPLPEHWEPINKYDQKVDHHFCRLHAAGNTIGVAPEDGRGGFIFQEKK